MIPTNSDYMSNSSLSDISSQTYQTRDKKDLVTNEEGTLPEDLSLSTPNLSSGSIHPLNVALAGNGVSLGQKALSNPSEVKATKKNLPLSFKSFVHSLLKAALRDDKKHLNTLFDLPLLGDQIPTVCKRLPSAKLVEYLIETSTDEFSLKELLRLVQKVNKSSYMASLSEYELLNIYASLFNRPQTNFLPKTIPFSQIHKVPARALPYVLTETLKHPAYQDASLSQVLSILRQFETDSTFLQSVFFTALFNHPAILRLPKDVLLHHFSQTPPAYKIPFLTKMIQHSTFKKTSFEELIGFIREFRNFPRNEPLTTLFYEAVFKHPAIKCISDLGMLSRIYPEESSDESIPFLSQVIKHPLGKEASLRTIKALLKSFHTLYKFFPCSDHLAEDFYSTVFKMPAMARATEQDLVLFSRKAPHTLFTLVTSFTLKHLSSITLPTQGLLTAFEAFYLEDTFIPVSRHINLKFIKAALSHPAISKMSSQEVLEKIITPAKGYKLVDIIVTALNSWEVKAFTLDELSLLNRLFLDEIEALEGPKSPYRMVFYTAVCEHLQEKGSLSKREANAVTHKLVHSYKVK